MMGIKQVVSAFVRAGVCVLPLAFSLIAVEAVVAQSSFEVATVRPSAGEVKFERNGRTEVGYGTLRMHDVTVATCIHWAYETPLPLIEGPSSLKHDHYDIVAKTDAGTTEQQMRLMMRALLKERFGLEFHRETRELRVYTLVVSKAGMKMHVASPDEVMSRENTSTGMVARSISMPELADYLADPLGAPLTDGTGLPGRYDLAVDFTPYVDMEQRDVRPDPVAVLGAALKGELGLELVRGRQQVDVTVVDRVGPPSSN